MQDASGVLKLYKPITIDDVEVKEIPYDFDAIPCNAIQTATKELASKHNYVVQLAVTDTMLHTLLFAKAADLHSNDVFRLSAKDQMKASGLSINFFNDDSEA